MPRYRHACPGLQCGHATLGAFEDARAHHPEFVDAWHHHGQTKVALNCPDEATMDAVLARCREAGLPCYVVVDAGRTQIAPGSRTVLGIGPAPVGAVDAITGPSGSHTLKLLG